MQKNFSICQSYAQALYELCKENDCLKPTYNLLKSFSVVASKEYLNLLSFFESDNNKKFQAIDKLFRENSSLLIKHFLYTMIKNHQMQNFINIFDIFEQKYFLEENILKVHIFSIRKLEKSELEKIEIILEKKMHKKIIFDNIIDESLIGGIKIVINDLIIDYSIKAKLLNIQQNISQGNR